MPESAEISETTENMPVSEQTMTLRLTQNEFVRGKWAPKGESFTFSKSESMRRLATQQFWEKV